MPVQFISPHTHVGFAGFFIFFVCFFGHTGQQMSRERQQGIPCNCNPVKQQHLVFLSPGRLWGINSILPCCHSLIARQYFSHTCLSPSQIWCSSSLFLCSVSCVSTTLLKPGALLQEGLDGPTNQSAFSADTPLKELYFTSSVANTMQC